MAVLQVYGLLWFTGIVFVPHITAGLLSDYKICGDSECESLMSRVQAIRDHHGEDCRFLSFGQGDNIFVYHKLTGRRDDLWAGTIDKQFGYFPKDAVQEEQVYATAEKVVETQRSDFFCMDELGHPVDFSDVDSGHEIEDQKIQTQETQLNPTIPDTEDTHAESHTSFHVSAQHTEGTALEGDETKNIGEGAAGSHMEAQSNPVALNEQGGSPSSSWLTSPVTGWLGLGREDKSVSLPEAETDNERQETKVETLTSSVSGWLGFGGEEKDNDAVKSEADGADSFTSSVTGWLGLSGEAEIDSPKTEQNTKSEIKEENIVKFNSRRMSLDLEDSQSREEEEKEDMPTLDWLGTTLSHTLGFGATSQESQPETRAEETIKEEREQSASSSWLGIGNILGYRKDESEVDDGTGGDFKDKVLEQEVIENENIKTSQMQSDEEKVEIKAQEQEQELEMESSESQDTGNNSISSSSKQDNNKEHVKEQCHVPQPETKAGFTTLALAEDIRNNNMKVSDGRKNDAASIVDQKHMSPQDTLEGGEEYDEHQVSKSIENNSSRESDEDITASNADLNVLTQSDISSGTGLFSVNLNSHTTTDKVDKEVNSSDQDEEGGEITPVEIGIGGDDHDNDGRTRETDPYVDVTAVTDMKSTETISSVKSIEAQESVSPETEQRVAEDDDGVDKLKGSEQNVQNNQIVSAESGLMEAMRSAAEMEAEENETMEEKQNGEQDELNKVEKVQEEEKKQVIVEETLAETSDVAEEKKKQGVNERQEREKQEDVVEFQEELNEVEEIKEEDKRKTESVDETYVKEKQRENEESREMELEGETDQETVQVDKEIQGGEKQRGLVELQDEEKREHLGDVNKVQGMMEVQDERDIKEWEKHEEVEDLKQELQNMEETRQEVVEEGGNVEEGKEEQKQQEDEKEKLHKMEEIREGEKQERVEELKEVEELIDKETMPEVKETREEKQQEELVEAKDEEKREHLGEANKVQGRMEVQDERDIKEWEKHEEVDDLKQELQNMEETRQEVVEEGGNVEEGKEEQKQQEADILKEKEKLQKMEEVREGEKQERVEELKEVEELIDKETMQEVKETREEKQQEELVEAKDEEKREPIERVNKEDEIKREEMQEKMLMKENERVEEIRELKKDEEKQEEVREFQEENRQESEEKEIRPEKREQVIEVKEEMLEDGVGLEVGEKQERGEASIENEKQKEVMEVQEEGEKEEVVAFSQEIKEAEKQEESEQRQVEEEEKQKEKDELKGDSEVVEEAKDEKKPPEVKGLKEEMEEFNEERRMLTNENNHGEEEEEWRKVEEIKERERQGDMEELGAKEKSDMEEVKEEETHEDVEDLKTEEKRVEEVKEEEKQVKEELMKKENEVKEEEAPDKVEGSKEEEKQTEIKEFQEDKQYKVEEVHEKHKQQEVKEIQEGNQEDEELKEEMRQEGLKEVKKREEILENEKIGEVEELKGGQGENLEELKVKEKVEVNEFKLEREEEVEQDDKRDEEEEQSVSDGKPSVDESRLTDEEKIHNHHTGQLQTKEGSFNIIQTEYVGLPHPHEILHRQAAENKEYGGLQPSEAKQSDLSADTVLNTEHDDSEAGRNETETEQILSQVNDQAVISDQTAPHVSKDPTGSSLMSDDGNTRTAETEDGGSFGLFKNVFGFYSQTPVTKTSDSGSGLTADETSQPQASLSSEQDIEQASPVAPSPGEPQYSSSSADILTSSPSNSHTPSQHIESSRQTKTLPKSYKFLLAYMSVDEVSSLIEPFGPYKLQFLDFMLGSSAAATEDESILSDIERQLHYHRETLSTPAMRQDDAPREDEEKTCTLVALQKLEMLITRVRETSRAKKSDTRGNDQAEVSCVSGSCSTNSKDGEMSTAGHSIKTEDPSIAQENNIQRDENTVEENRGQRCTGEMKSAHDKRPDLEGGCEEKSVHFADHPHNQSGSPQTREGALEVILNTVHHIAQESVSRVNAVREFLIWTAQVRLLFT